MRVVGRNQPLFERAGEGDDLEGRARLVDVLERVVAPRLGAHASPASFGSKDGALASASISPVRGSSTTAVADFACVRSIAAASSRSTMCCTVSVNGQHERLAVARLAPGALKRPALRVRVEDEAPRLARQRRVVNLLDAAEPLLSPFSSPPTKPSTCAASAPFG